MKSWWQYDPDYYPETPHAKPTIYPIEPTNEFTGILDQDGKKIYRANGVRRMGFPIIVRK